MNTPTEYFGPHAKRWTDPDTGETLSLSPRDYYREIAKEQLQREKEVAERIQEAESAAWNDEALDEGVVIIDRLGDPDAAPEAGLFKDRGVLIMPPGIVEVEVESSPLPAEDLEVNAQLKERFPDHYVEGATPEKVKQALIKKGWMQDPDALVLPSGWNPPEDQRYEMEVESSPVVPPEMAGRYDAIVYGATRGGIKYPTAESLVRGRIHSATLSHDGMGHVSTSSSEPAVPVCPQEQPAAHHLRKRLTSPRFWVTLGLVYIIAIIGVTAVTGVIS